MTAKATTQTSSELMPIVDGSGTVTGSDGVAIELTAGDTYLPPPGSQHQWQNDSYVQQISCGYSP